MSNSHFDVTAAKAAAPFQPSLPGVPWCGFLRQAQVLALVPVSKSTLWRRVQAGSFPAPLKLSERVTVWRAEDVQAWIKAQDIAYEPTFGCSG